MRRCAPSSGRASRAASARFKPAEPRRERSDALALRLAAAELSEGALAAHHYQLQLLAVLHAQVQLHRRVIGYRGLHGQPASPRSPAFAEAICSGRIG